MKTMVISDLHFGAGNSWFVQDEKKTIDLLIDRIVNNHIDVLIFAGDMLDFSLCSYRSTFLSARRFFSRLAAHPQRPKQIIYIPGNHDKNVWNLLRDQVMIIRPMTEYGAAPPENMPDSFFVVLDLADGVPEVYKHKQGEFDHLSFRGGHSMLAGLFETHGEVKEENMISFSLAYPNLYLESKKGVYLVTHGHFFQVPWSLFSLLWRQTILEERKADNTKPLPEYLVVDEIEGVNSPLTLMVWASMGQVPQIREVMNRVYLESAEKQQAEQLIALLEEALENYYRHVRYDERRSLSDRVSQSLSRWGLKRAVKHFTKHGSKPRVPHLFDEHVNRFLTQNFIEASAWLYQHRRDVDLGETPFPEIICGHTHHAREAMSKPADWLPGVTFRNCGGWVNEDNCHAMAFILDENGDITPEPIKFS